MMTKAMEAVDAIVRDLTDRRGLRQEWEGIDGSTQAEIRGRWTRIICGLFGDEVLSGRILDDLVAERSHQIARWGGHSHDDGHNAYHWMTFLSAYLGKASLAAMRIVSGPGSRQEEVAAMRGRLIQVAALAIAAVESLDRVYPVSERRNEP